MQTENHDNALLLTRRDDGAYVATVEDAEGHPITVTADCPLKAVADLYWLACRPSDIHRANWSKAARIAAGYPA